MEKEKQREIEVHVAAARSEYEVRTKDSFMMIPGFQVHTRQSTSPLFSSLSTLGGYERIRAINRDMEARHRRGLRAISGRRALTGA